jgi:hypothetical protein
VVLRGHRQSFRDGHVIMTERRPIDEFPIALRRGAWTRWGT